MNPRAAINDLLPFQGSPFGQLGYFSKLPFQIFPYLLFSISNGLNYNSSFLVLSSLFFIFFSFFLMFFFHFQLVKTNGESGIRTHAPLRTNGFQDRLVMTTSISLHIEFSRFFRICSVSAEVILSSKPVGVNIDFTFFVKTLYRFD